MNPEKPNQPTQNKYMDIKKSRNKNVIITSTLAVLSLIIIINFNKIFSTIDLFYYNTFYSTEVMKQTKTSGEFLHYKSKKYGIEFDYPEGFLVNDSLPSYGGRGAIITIQGPIIGKYKRGGILAINVFNIPDEDKQLQLKEILKGEGRLSFVNEDTIRSSDVMETTINGLIVVYFVIDEYPSHDIDEGIIDLTQYDTTKKIIFFHNEKAYLVSFSDRNSEYPQSIINGDKIIQSIKFFK